ncbi:ATP-binding cassette, subfamily F, member 3 [Halopseudomonas xinjiangensis]|uniref:Probable ATP-binding protein YheS n=1 Tax=Halopseudomonas xinjiangensis TaxID=487184 RepID=A0A1H1YK86_9GAMM|nr:ATP-binding cassette domain-containing protein [Halopseudomonas xinjiangensis]SDT21833.1 ATP-binding cassette, subfamily F, member 3 [Halopseudomonas xinjiangensis]
MIKIESLTLQRGPLRLLDNANLTIHPGQKVGLLGTNGAGKSSLFALLRGQLTPDAGSCSLPDDWRLSHMRQEIEDLERNAVDYVLDGDQRLRDIQKRLAEAEARQDAERLGTVYAELESHDGFTADSRARTLLAGLGFTSEQTEARVGDFSGGWRMRLNLAQALMCPSDLLLLDEPTNHLDLDAILWLEDWLRSYSGTLLLISHDRDFLDAVIESIVHVDQKQLVLYRGSYSQFERTRAERLAQQQAAFEKQQAQREHMQRYIARFRAQATKARQAQSRLKALERMEVLSQAHIDSPFSFSFREADKQSSPLLDLRKGQLGYGEQAILEQVKLQLAPGARIGVLGPNGAGKSTLIKTLAGSLPLQAGELKTGEHLAIGYFAQHQLDSLDPEASPLLHLARLAPQEREQTLRNFIGGFDFHGDRAEEPVRHFSGGEKARLALALIAWQKPNLLLLDEPTNHLDMEMRHALTLALQDFDGAMLLVSHDRALIRDTTDELWLVADGRLQVYEDDLDTYTRWLARFRQQQAQSQADGTAEDPEQPKVDAKAQRRLAAEQRQRLAPMKKAIDKLEQSMSRLNSELEEIESALGDTSLYQTENKDRLKELLARQTSRKQELETLEAQWLDASEEMESLQASAEF